MSIIALNNYIKQNTINNYNTFSKIHTDISSIISVSVPSIKIDDYIKIIFTSEAIQKENVECVIIHAIYILNSIKTKGIYLNPLNVHRFVLVVLMLSSKVCQDIHYKNNYWAYIGGITTYSINQMEVQLLTLFNFDLDVTIKPEKILSILKSTI